MMGSSSFRRFRVLLLPLLVVTGFVLRTSAATLVVDDDGDAPFRSIQKAIDAAVPGQDDVFVRCGTYVENLVMRDGVSVGGEGADCTILHPETGDTAVVLMPSLGPDTSFGRFTVHNVESPSPGTGGIQVDLGAPIITQNFIQGPGLDPVFFSGPGISVSGGAPVISYNIIKGNYSCCYGGGILLDGSQAEVRSNLIVANASYYGAGLMTEYGSSRITINTIVNNEGWLGGGVMVSGGEPVDLANNVIAFNSAVIYGGGVVEWIVAEGSFESNDLFGNLPEDIVGPRNPIGESGNISEDPAFVDQNDDSFASFQPRSDSPLVDSGSPAWTRERDLRGIAGPVDGDVDGAPVIDIGARENEGVTGVLHTGTGFVWDPGRNEPPLYNVYRGDLATLVETGVYTQDPLAVDGAAQFCELTNGINDLEVPPTGRGFFYLAVELGTVEGTLGFDSAPQERPTDPPLCR